MPLKEQFLFAAAAVDGQFDATYPKASEVADVVRKAVKLAKSDMPRQEAMESLQCKTAPECVAGAVYACLTSPEDFDAAMITAVNHSGLSAAVGAIAGALLGAKLGDDALPEFYLESLEQRATLEELAEDMAKGSIIRGLFDDDWDRKYTHGLPL